MRNEVAENSAVLAAFAARWPADQPPPPSPWRWDDQRRARQAQDWLVREVTPAMLYAAGMERTWWLLRNREPIGDASGLEGAKQPILVAAEAAREARGRAEAQARGTTWAEDRVVPWPRVCDDVLHAALRAVWVSVCIAGYRDADWETIFGAASDATQDALAAAAWDAVRTGAGTGQLEKVASDIDASAHSLVRRMCEIKD